MVKVLEGNICGMHEVTPLKYLMVLAIIVTHITLQLHST